MDMRRSLYEMLEEYSAQDIYPFHMPGHKRNREAAGMKSPYLLDITEVEGFDDLHHASGILKEAQEKAAQVYEAQETHFLINGSTAGILSAISGCMLPGETLLMARNCHRSAYHAASLRRLQVRYLYPCPEELYHLNGGIDPAQVQEELEREPNIRAVFLTSPTYDGILSDIRTIAGIVHEKGKILIVDEAHGAHLQFHSYFPESALQCGADIVIHSVHKTLPSLTQTALLHFSRGNRIREAVKERIRRFLSIYQSSSPSYILMASIDRCMDWLQRKGTAAYDAYIPRLEQFRAGMGGLENIHLAGRELIGTACIAAVDCSRIVLAAPGFAGSGPWIYGRLLKQFAIQMEMAAEDTVVGISTCMDSSEGLDRLEKAVKYLDREIASGLDKRPKGQEDGQVFTQTEILRQMRNETILPIYEAADRPWAEVKLAEAAGSVCGEYLYLYPPGIPLFVPGERMDKEGIALLGRLMESGLAVKGLGGDTADPVVKICK